MIQIKFVRGHFSLELGLSNLPCCPRCFVDEKTAKHILCHCPSFCNARPLGAYTLSWTSPKEAICRFTVNMTYVPLRLDYLGIKKEYAQWTKIVYILCGTTTTPQLFIQSPHEALMIHRPKNGKLTMTEFIENNNNKNIWLDNNVKQAKSTSY